MAIPGPPPRAALICGLLAGRDDWLDRAARALAEEFGPIALDSGSMAFDFTDYYRREMGDGLLRRFVAPEGRFDPARLGEVKRRTHALEADLADALAGEGVPPRPVNLDPGYVEQGKLVLASLKNFAHRVYLGRGVYAEVTLQWRHGRWRSLPWTFPDYASGRYDRFLTDVRDALGARPA